MLRFLIFLAKIGLFLALIGSAATAYIVYHYSKNLPDYSQLRAYYPPCVTRMYSSDGKLIEEYAREHRIFVPIQTLPKPLIEAFIAAEDKNYYSHPGVDIMSIIRAAINNISRMMNNQGVEGGSTITQQVVKNFLLSSERSLERKIKEAILSYMISQSLTKDEILELYLNQIYLGKGAHGVAAAALAYFNKSVEELTINESAVLASMPKAPSKFDPARHYDRVFERKNYVIGRMYQDGYITEEEARKAVKEPIILGKYDKAQSIDADYYAEQVREEVINMFGSEYFYTAGLTIITCVDSKIQKYASKALIDGIIEFDRKKGYRGPIKNIDLINWQDDMLNMKIPEGLKNDKLAVVLSVEDSEAKIGFKDTSRTTLSIKDMKWTRTNLKSIKTILKPGDVIAVSKEGEKYVLSQIPLINGALMVMEPSTGKVLAAEGGYDFGASKFNRVNQAMRQPGSLIKPFVYLAALENGIPPNKIFEDAPLEISQGPGLPMWTPKNHDSKFMGPITMRKGIEKSRNLITIRVGLTVGLKKVAETIRRFGINDQPMNVNSILLGALETTLERMTTAFAIIANNGKKVTPNYIELIKDRKGNVIYRREGDECAECKHYAHDENGAIIPPILPEPPAHTITDEASSYQMSSFLRGVVERGTASRAKVIKKIMAGKTGTTNNAKDTWYVGFTPRMVVGTYVGYDQPKSLGIHAYGSNVALPIYVNFMKMAYENYPDIDFAVPKSISLARVNYETGLPSRGEGSIVEAFKVNNYNSAIENNQDRSQKSHDVFNNIQDLDPSQEIY